MHLTSLRSEGTQRQKLSLVWVKAIPVPANSQLVMHPLGPSVDRQLGRHLLLGRKNIINDLMSYIGEAEHSFIQRIFEPLRQHQSGTCSINKTQANY